MAARLDPALKADILGWAGQGQRPKDIAQATGLPRQRIADILCVARQQGKPVPFYNGPKACRRIPAAVIRLLLWDEDTLERLDGAAKARAIPRQVLINRLLDQASTMIKAVLDDREVGDD